MRLSRVCLVNVAVNFVSVDSAAQAESLILWLWPETERVYGGCGGRDHDRDHANDE